MALIHQTATLTPSKLELLAAWLPGRAWAGGARDLRSLGSYRFDDPAGEVGIETFVLGSAQGTLLQVPLTYRDARRSGADDHLVGRTEHSVLGRRWVYDGCGDPVWAAALVRTVLTGGTGVDELVESEGGRLVPRTPSASVAGSGTPGTAVPAVTEVTAVDSADRTRVRAGELTIVVARIVGTPFEAAQTLTGRWRDGGTAVLAGVTVG